MAQRLSQGGRGRDWRASHHNNTNIYLVRGSFARTNCFKDQITSIGRQSQEPCLCIRSCTTCLGKKRMLLSQVQRSRVQYCIHKESKERPAELSTAAPRSYAQGRSKRDRAGKEPAPEMPMQDNASKNASTPKCVRAPHTCRCARAGPSWRSLEKTCHRHKIAHTVNNMFKE